MNKVVTVNLNGNPFVLEEPAYEALRAYLDDAAARLQGDPDRAEIVADLEQAIADKCRQRLGPHKSVVGSAEMQTILAEMGPVETGPGDEEPGTRRAKPEPQTAPNAPRRLYQIREGAMIAGVCNGLAAYLNVDVTIVRVAFVVLTLLTGGIWIFAYLIMMIVVPSAKTAEEHAAARGLPFNAQELVDRAKQHYSELREQGSRWHDDWRRRRRERRSRRQAEAERDFWRSARGLEYYGNGYASRVTAGFMVPVFAALSAALFVLLVLASLSLLINGGILDWTLPARIPPWVAVLILVVAHMALTAPLRAASQATYQRMAGPNHGWVASADGLLWLGFAALLFWLAYEFSPDVRAIFRDLWHNWGNFAFVWAASW
jgi:phage shock protein PspC (stress-responsive transcriptional regulator)